MRAVIRRLRATALLGVILLSAGATTAQSQHSAVQPTTPNGDEIRSGPGKTSISLMAGQFIYNRGGGDKYPYASARFERSVSRFFAGELSLGYSRLNTKLYSLTPTIQSYDAHTPFFAADVALHAILPLGRFAPYAGVSAGLFRRQGSTVYDNLALNGSSVGGLVGGRLLLNQRFGLRGEFRIRGDNHDGATALSSDAEQSFGMFYRL